MRSFRVMAMGLAVVSASSSTAFSQQKTQPPVFPTATGLVLVDFVVTDKSDRVVGGLKPQDFVVKEDGKERPIVSFASFAKGLPAGGLEPQAKAAPPDASKVTTVLFVDDAQLTPQDTPRIQPALKKLVDVIAEQEGVLALVAPASNIQMAEEAAGNRALFGAAIDKIVGRQVDDHSMFPLSDAEAIFAEQGDTTVIERVAARIVYLNRGVIKYDMALVNARGRAQEVAAAARIRRRYAYAVLLKSLDWLARKPGRHSVVMVSGGYANDPDDPMQHEVISRSLQANAPIHFLDARGVQGVSRYLGVEYRKALEYDAVEPPLAFSEAAGGAADIAADTGGLYIRNTNDIVKGMNRILDMTTTYYVLGYEPPEHTKGGFRKIKVEVATKGLRVLSRRGYFDEAVAPR